MNITMPITDGNNVRVIPIYYSTDCGTDLRPYPSIERSYPYPTPEMPRNRCGYCGRKVDETQPICDGCGAPL